MSGDKNTLRMKASRAGVYAFQIWAHGCRVALMQLTTWNLWKRSSLLVVVEERDFELETVDCTHTSGACNAL